MNDQREGEERPKVELRSDVSGLDPVQELKKVKMPQWLPLAIGAVIFVIVIGIGAAWFGISAPERDGTSSGEDGGLFGNLPDAANLLKTPRTTSGLSGRECDHPTRRPIGVMLAGDPINRPMSGFSEADMVFELPVLVSNVTRLLAVYQCGEPADIGSIRSARHDYLFLAEGVDAIVAHWGGSYHALNRISAGEFHTINALTNPFNAYFRKNHLPAPYNGFSTYERLWNALEKLEYRTTTEFEGYEFKDDVDAADRPSGGTLSVGWPGQFRVHYEYNQETNRYDRFWAGTKQVDASDDQPVAPSAVVIMRATNEFAEGPGGYNDVGIEGEGVVEVYQDGEVITGTWQKNELYKTEAIKFLNGQGQPITFTRGQVWVMAPSADIAVTWEPVEASASLESETQLNGLQ